MMQDTKDILVLLAFSFKKTIFAWSKRARLMLFANSSRQRKNSHKLLTRENASVPPKTAFLESSFFQSLGICEYLQLPPNVRTNGSCNRLPGIACHFTCERGFNLIGSAIRWCDRDGFWTGTQPQCDGKLIQN